MTDIDTGTAEFVRYLDGYVICACPHCGCNHAHQRASVGSREVLAHCARNGELKTYGIPQPLSHGRKRKPRMTSQEPM